MRRSSPASAVVAAAVILCLLATPPVPGGWLIWLPVVPARLAVAAGTTAGRSLLEGGLFLTHRRVKTPRT